MKLLKMIGLISLIIIVILVVVFNIWGGWILKNALQVGGTSIMGVPVKVDSIDLRIIRGLVEIKGLVVGNPKGFKTEQAISVGEITLELIPKTLFRDTLIINRIYVKAPDITYEVGLGKSNIGRLLEEMESASRKKETEPKPAQKSGGKKVIIEDLLVEHGRVRLSMTLAGGAAAPIPLPPIHMKDVGKEKEGGASIVDVVKTVLRSILGTVTNMATGTVGAVSQGAKTVGEETVKAVKGVGDGASKMVKGFTGIFKPEEGQTPQENAPAP